MIGIIRAKITELQGRKQDCWRMMNLFMKQDDYHGCHDMGIELAALDRAIAELKSVLDTPHISA